MHFGGFNQSSFIIIFEDKLNFFFTLQGSVLHGSIEKGANIPD